MSSLADKFDAALQTEVPLLVTETHRILLTELRHDMANAERIDLGLVFRMTRINTPIDWTILVNGMPFCSIGLASTPEGDALFDWRSCYPLRALIVFHDNSISKPIELLTRDDARRIAQHLFESVRKQFVADRILDRDDVDEIPF